MGGQHFAISFKNHFTIGGAFRFQRIPILDRMLIGAEFEWAAHGGNIG